MCERLSSYSSIVPPSIIQSTSNLEKELIEEAVEKTKWQKEALKLRKREDELVKELKLSKLNMVVGLVTNRFGKVRTHIDEL